MSPSLIPQVPSYKGETEAGRQMCAEGDDVTTREKTPE